MFNKRHSNIFGSNLNESEKIFLKNAMQDLIQKCYNRGFQNGIKCPKCGNSDLNKNGITNGRQRYICKKCRTTFDERSFSPFSNTKLSLDKWIKYCRIMIDGGTIKHCAEEVSVSVPTSFFMRHRILDIMNASLRDETLSGIVATDTCYMNESFKGAHIKEDDLWSHLGNIKEDLNNVNRDLNNIDVCLDNANRNLLEYNFLKHDLNKYASEKYFSSFDRDKLASTSFFFNTCINTAKKREKNIKQNQICVNTAIDSNGNIVTRVVDNEFGITNNKIKPHGMVSFFNKKLAENVTLCVYTPWLYREIGIKLRQSPRANSKVYTVNHVYKYHLELRRWLKNFNGVATKYLNNYLAWFKFLFVSDRYKKFKKTNKIFMNLDTIDLSSTKQMIKNRCVELL